MKKCVSCGADNTDESRFCKGCGAELGGAAASPDSSEPLVGDGETGEIGGFSFRPVPDEEIRALVSRKTPLAEKILTTVLAFIIIFGLIFMVCDIRESQQKVQIERLCSGNKSVFLYNGERLDGSVKGEIYCSVSSADGSAAYALTTDSRLYSVSEKGVLKVSKNAENAIISSNGRFIFFTDDEQNGYLYNVKKNKSEEIASGIDISTAVFSPDGETLAFSTRESSELYIYSGGDCEKIDSGVACAAVSDGARRLYAVSYAAEPVPPEKPDASDYEEYDDYKDAYDKYSALYEKYEEKLEEYEEYLDGENICFYYYPSANADRRTKLTDELLYGAEFNKDISQTVFRETDGRTYFCQKDGEPERISKDSIYPCSYNDTSFYCGISSNEVIGRESLLNMNYRGEDTLWYVDRKCSAVKIDDDIFQYTALKISDNGKKLCYVNGDGKLYLTDAKSGDRERIAKDAVSFIPEKNFGAFYVLDSDGKLYYIRKNGDKEKIDRDVYKICEAPSGGIYYLTDDGDLYFAKKDKTEKIDGSGDVLEIESGESFAMYFVRDSKKDKYATYISVNGDEDFDEVYKSYVPFDYAHYAE